MILIFILGLVALRILYSVGEVYYERDWPRSTWKGLLIALGVLCIAVSAFGQAARVDIPLQTSGPNVPISGGPLPQALWVANAAAYLCTHPSTTLAACQAAPITTYTDSTEGTTCPTATPLVQLPGNTCTAATGTTANVGFWYGGGVFDYWIVSSYGTYGPFSGNSSNSALPSSCGNPIGIPCGGTGATTAAGALTSLGAAALSGATFTGPVSGTSASFSGTVAAGTSVSAPFVNLTSTLPTQYLNVAGWGDSLTAGNEGLPVPTNSTWPIQLEGISGLNTYNGGEGGDGAYQIYLRYTADTTHKNWLTVFEAGTNDLLDVPPYNGVLSYINQMVAQVPAGVPYVILPPVLNILYGTGSAQQISQAALMATEASTYGTHYLDTWTPLLNDYNPSIPTDVWHHAQGTTAPSVRAKYSLGSMVMAAAITDTTSCLPLTYPTNFAGYSPSPMEIYIDNEFILYTTTTACTRGYAGTTATTHAIGAPWGGYDLIHLNQSGYALWASLIKGWINNNGNAAVDIGDFSGMWENQFALNFDAALLSPSAIGSVTPAPSIAAVDFYAGPANTTILAGNGLYFTPATATPNYIENDTVGGGLAFITNGRSTSFANSNLALNSDQSSEFYGPLTVTGAVIFSGGGLAHAIVFPDPNAGAVYTASQVLSTFFSPMAGTVPAGGAGTYNGVAATSYCNLGTAATASTTFTFADGGTSFGTVAFAASGTTGTFTISSAKAIASGDKITLTAPATADATAAGLNCSLVFAY